MNDLWRFHIDLADNIWWHLVDKWWTAASASMYRASVFHWRCAVTFQPILWRVAQWQFTSGSGFFLDFIWVLKVINTQFNTDLWTSWHLEKQPLVLRWYLHWIMVWSGIEPTLYTAVAVERKRRMRQTDSTPPPSPTPPWSSWSHIRRFSLSGWDRGQRQTFHLNSFALRFIGQTQFYELNFPQFSFSSQLFEFSAPASVLGIHSFVLLSLLYFFVYFLE